MPVVTTVKQVLRMQDGEPVQAFKGKVKEVFKRRVGTTQRGNDYSVQNLICVEGDAKIEVVLWNAEDPIRQDREGSYIYIEAEEDDGVIANDNEWKGKRKRQLKCSKFTLAWNDEQKNGEDEGESAQQTETRERPHQAPPQKASLSEAKFFTARCANGMILAMRAAMHVGKTVETESKLVFPPEWIQRAVFEIYGSMERAGMLQAMPVKPIEKPKPAYEPGVDEEPPSKIAGREDAHDAQKAEFPDEDLPSKPATTPAIDKMAEDDVPF